ncbi:MAG: TetR/AcrR family transcriptional regulator [Lachnospiraceae bacterium]|nr:TetR/AcrR family transcriptional regulator [Lachnospiraceae bacterium]
MEDKRIRKTKKNLKSTLILMLNEMSFESISITELCKRADISRITFYTHYSDKYALIDDIFLDMIHTGTEIHHHLQTENNPQHLLVQSYCNVLHCIMELYYSNYDFFRHTKPEKNPYLAFSFYNHVLKTIENYTTKKTQNFRLKYSAKKIAGFLCYGMVGFINESHSENVPLEQIKEEATSLLTGLLASDILVET